MRRPTPGPLLHVKGMLASCPGAPALWNRQRGADHGGGAAVWRCSHSCSCARSGSAVVGSAEGRPVQPAPRGGVCWAASTNTANWVSKSSPHLSLLRLQDGETSSLDPPSETLRRRHRADFDVAPPLVVGQRGRRAALAPCCSTPRNGRSVVTRNCAGAPQRCWTRCDRARARACYRDEDGRVALAVIRRPQRRLFFSMRRAFPRRAGFRCGHARRVRPLYFVARSLLRRNHDGRSTCGL